METSSIAAATRKLLSSYDRAKADSTAERLRAVWLGAAPDAVPELTPKEAQFMRDWGIRDPGFQAVGIPVPVLSAVGNEIGRAAARRVDDFLPLAGLLWRSYGREGRIVAVTALGPMELADPEKVVPLIGELARSCAFWEDCDQLAMRALEPVLRKDPAVWLERIGVWVGDDSKWVRRAALTAIGRLPMKQPAWTGRCVALLAPALGDPDADVKRALSFALRACARGDVTPVKQFVVDHRQVADTHSLWVTCDLVRSMTASLLPRFCDLLPIYESWLASVEPKARRSVEAALQVLRQAAQRQSHQPRLRHAR